MVEVVYYVAASLDGFIATPDGGVEWLAPFEGGGEDYGYAQFYATMDALLMGRRTYEQCLGLGAWPYAGKPCRVFSRRALQSPPPDVGAAASTGPTLSELAQRGVKRAWLVGGGVLAASFRTERLITEYIISVVPVILGGGVPLFAGSGSTESLVLTGSRTYPGGIVQLRYRPAQS